MGGPRVRGHDGHRRADRPARHRSLPHADLTLRPRPGRAPRRDRAPALRAHPAGGGRALHRQRAAAARRSGSGLRPGRAGRSARSDALQPGRGRPLQDPLPGPAGGRLFSRRAPRAQRGRGLPRRRHEGPGGVRGDAQARAHPHPRRLRAGRDRRARQRPAAGRGLELAPGHGLHAPGAHRLQAHLPAARGPRDPPHSGQGGGHRRRLRPPRDPQRRSGGDAALPARPRRLPRWGDRGRTGAPRPWPAPAGGTARGAGDRRRGPPRAGLRARAVADGRGAPDLGPAAGLGHARRRPCGLQQLAPCQGHAALRLDRRAATPVPGHLPAPQPQHPAAPAGAGRGRATCAIPRRSTTPWRSWAAGRARSAARA